MKILCISNLFPPHNIGGYEIICSDVMHGMIRRGHEVTVLCSDYQSPQAREGDSIKVIRKLRIHGMYGSPWLPMHRLFRLEKHNHEVLREAITTTRPDVIYIWNMGGISKSLLHDAEQSGIPCVYFVSDHWIARSLRADVWLQWWNVSGSATRNILRTLLDMVGVRRMLKSIAPTEPWTQLRFPTIYFCSHFMKQTTLDQGWPVSHGLVFHNGVSSRDFAIKQDYSGFKRLLWVGRISEDKDPYTAVRALRLAHDRGLTDLTLDIYGGGTEADLARLTDLIHSLHLDHAVKRNSATPAEMRQLYSQYDALVFTSNWGEPFALTPLEASASGLPVISTLDGGQKEIVRDQINAIQVEAGNPESFAHGIELLAKQPELRVSIATEALREIQEKFDYEKLFDKIEALLNQVSANTRSGN